MKTITIALIFFTGVACFAEAGEAPAAKLALETVPATGKQSTVLAVTKFGRYTLLAHSAQGTALQLVDRMAGPGDIAGVAGEQDGRLDLFLNRGEYKIMTHAHDTGSGDVKLSVRSYMELHGQNFPQLIKLKNIALSLDDFQQRSFWLYIEKRETVAVEAAGRNLADLRLWKDGSWLMDVTPTAKQIFPHAEKPLLAMQLNVELEPGLYLLTTYGGPDQPWTEQSDEHPLYLRYGLPRLDETGQQRYTVSVFGTDRYVVPGNSNYFNLSVPEATAISLTVATYDKNAAFAESGSSVEISKKSIPPVTELELTTQKPDRIVTVSATAGQSYTLQHFEKRWRYSFSHSGRYWLSSIHSGAAADSVDATSVLTRLPRFQAEQFFDARVIKLDKTEKYQRRFNLLDTLTLYLEILEPGKYVVTGQGEAVAAKYRVEPFLTSRPKDYQAPPFENSGYQWELDAGFYVLTVRPELKGILTLTVEKEDYVPMGDTGMPSVAGATRYGVVNLDSDSFYTMYLNQQPGVAAGIVLRSVPVDLSRALPIMQRGNETVSVPVKLPEQGEVHALTTTGDALELSIDDRNWAKQLSLASGTHTISIRNIGSNTVNYSLEFSAARLTEASPLPELPPATLRSLPDFPSLVADQPVYFDLDRNQPATYLLKVDKPALYRLESSGLLDTEGNLRTRTNPSLVRQQANGVGRNFLIQQYLREGDYQLTVKPRHQSRGHLGIGMAHTAITDGGQLTTGVVARQTLKAGEGLLYRFIIKQKGKYHLRAIGAGRTYVMRLEDDRGWPIEPPNIAADITREFDVGEYRMIVRPEAVDVRVVATLDAVPEPMRYQGHGPHHIGVGQTVQHQWQEPVKGGDRIPDVWLFDLPASADITISLNNEMQGELFHDDSLFASITAVKPWQGQLAAGQYRLAIKNARQNNQVDYQMTVNSRQLMTGQQRHVGVPAAIPIAVGEQGYVELWSYGQNDVKARLIDAQGNVVAQGDDRNNDWNFFIAEKLLAGDYTLEVQAVSGGTQPAVVFMQAPRTRLETPQLLPMDITISDSDAHLYPLQLPDKSSLLIIQAESQDVVGLSIEVQNHVAGQPSSWSVLGSKSGKTPLLLLPYANSQSYRLRVWSVDRRGAVISLAAQAIEPTHYSERQLIKSGVNLKSVSGPKNFTFPIAVAVIDLPRPGVFKVDDASELLWSSQSNGLLEATYNGLVTSSGSTLWLAKQLGKNQKNIKLNGSRMVLGDQGLQQLQIVVPPHQLGQLDIKAHHGPLLVLADSRVGRSGVYLSDIPTEVETPDARRFAIARRSAVAAMVKPDNPVVKVWNAADSGDALEVNLRRVVFRLEKPKTIPVGRFEAAVDSAAALPLALPVGLKRVALTLPPDTAAVMQHQNNVTSTHWSGNAPLNDVLYSHAHELLIMNTATKSQHVALNIELLVTAGGAAGGAPALREHSVFQHHFPNAGQLRIPVNYSETSGILRLRGPSQGVYVQHDGRILQGTDLNIAGPGELFIRHQPGVVTAWIESNIDSKITTPLPVVDLTTIQSIALQGEIQTYQTNLQESVQLNLRSDTALLTRITYANGNEIIEAHPQGVNYSVYLPSGYSTLSFQRLGSGAVDGMLFISSAMITPIQEGFGPQTILSGGGTQMYYFDVTQSGPVGVGVQASSDLVSGKLLDSAGNTISQGVVHMFDLAPGRYVLAVSVPADSQPVQVRPALVGLQRPPSGPPWEIIKAYLEQAGHKLAAPP